MAQCMGLHPTMNDGCFKRKFRWMFEIPDIVGAESSMIAPSKGARPSLTFKEMEIQHVSETVYYPSKPDWKPINLTLYDMKSNSNKVFDWIKKMYDPSSGRFITRNMKDFKKEVKIKLFDGCGDTLETWTLENAYPQVIEWGDLDYSASDVVTVDITLRYDRAHVS